MRFSDEQRLLAATSPAGLALTTSHGKWSLARHLDYIDEKIVDAVAGRGPKRLVVEVPPRHGKSELISHRTPAWYLGMFPDRQVMLASYEASFAQTWGRKSRDLLEGYGKELYGVSVKHDARAQERWYTDQGGVMAASGIGGTFTGMGADLLIIDDPLKNSQEARSEVIREKHKDWWKSTAITRLHPGAVVIVLMTRWHEQDLGGFLLEQGADDGGEPFTEIRIPALAEENDVLGRQPGEALWPERYSADILEKLKHDVGSYWWAAMYQGRPSPEGGGMFNRKWFDIVPAAPASDADAMQWVRYWDFASTEQTATSDPDWTVGAKVGKHPNGTFYVADIVRVRKTPQGVEEIVRNTAAKDGPGVKIWIEQEPGSSGKIVIDHYVRTVLPEYTVRGRKETGSKVVRADPVSAKAEARLIKVVGAPHWNPAFFDELEAFPNGAHDDQVDGLTGAMAVLSTDRKTYGANYRPTPGAEPVYRRGDITLVGEKYIDKD